MDLFVTTQNETLEKGDFLISEPFLSDAHFQRSVILICEHNTEGTLGLVLNKKLPLTLHDVLDTPSHIDFSLFLGGPVSQNLMFVLYRGKDMLDNSTRINSELYMTPDYEMIEDKILLNQLKSEDVKLFLGYAGWETNQLQGEIQKKFLDYYEKRNQ